MGTWVKLHGVYHLAPFDFARRIVFTTACRRSIESHVIVETLIDGLPEDLRVCPRCRRAWETWPAERLERLAGVPLREGA